MKVVYCHNRNLDFQVTSLSGIIQFNTELPQANIQINPKGGSTVAMESIPSWLLDTVQQGDTIVRKVGIARCSDEDNYCKKTGRELAQSRLKQTTLTVVNLVRIGEFVTVFFEDEKGNLFEVKKSSDPHCARLIRMLND